MSKLLKEASLKETQFLSESNKLMEAEAKLHRAEQEKSRMINNMCRLNIKLTEAKDRESEGKEQCGEWEGPHSSVVSGRGLTAVW